MFGTQQLIPLFCLRVDVPPLFYTCSTGEGTAGDKIRLRCIVRTSEGLVARPFLNWTGVGVGDSAVTESEIIVVSEIESERHLTFNPLRTSHGGWYRSKPRPRRLRPLSRTLRPGTGPPCPSQRGRGGGRKKMMMMSMCMRG